jgi:hypothetical protein
MTGFFRPSLRGRAELGPRAQETHLLNLAHFDDDYKLLEKYQCHSAELVRVALLGVAGIGALFVTKPDAALIRLTNPLTRWCFVLALIGFGLSAGFGLMHRYFSTDSMACLLKRSRLEAEVPRDDAKIRKETARLFRAFDLSAWSIGASAISLGLGAVVLAAGFILAISPV